MALCKFVFFVAVIIGGVIGWRWGIEGVAVGVTLGALVQYVITIRVGLTLLGAGTGTYLRTLFHGTGLALIMAVLSLGLLTLFRLVGGGPLVVLAGVSVLSWGALTGMVYRWPQLLGASGRWAVDILFKHVPWLRSRMAHVAS